MLKSVIGMFVALALLGACGTTNVGSDYKPQASQESGLLVLSLTRSLDPGGFQGRLGSIDHMNLQYVNLASGAGGTLSMGASLLGTLGSSGAFEGGNGRLFVLELAPGDYAIQSFRFHHNGRVYTARPGFSLPFKVAAGAAKYAGEVNVEFYMLENLLGSGVVDDYVVNVKDSRERDFAMLTKSHPNIRPTEIQVELMRPQQRPRRR